MGVLSYYGGGLNLAAPIISTSNSRLHYVSPANCLGGGNIHKIMECILQSFTHYYAL